MRSYAKVWVDADYTGNGLVFYTEDQFDKGGNTTALWLEYPHSKQDLVDSLNSVFSALHRGVTMDPYEALFGSRLLSFAYAKHPRKN
jgi:hypothetical protein